MTNIVNSSLSNSFQFPVLPNYRQPYLVVPEPPPTVQFGPFTLFYQSELQRYSCFIFNPKTGITLSIQHSDSDHYCDIDSVETARKSSDLIDSVRGYQTVQDVMAELKAIAHDGPVRIDTITDYKKRLIPNGADLVVSPNGDPVPPTYKHPRKNLRQRQRPDSYRHILARMKGYYP